MSKYLDFKYIFPPRPKNASPISDIPFWDNDTMIGQPKMNGSNAVIFLNGKDSMIYNRHGNLLSNVDIDKSEVLDLYRGNGWMVLNGEYLNKNKKDENNQYFNHKLVIFDILVYDSNYLIGDTFQSRIELLNNLYGEKNSDKYYLNGISKNVYRVKSYYSGFNEIFKDLIKIDIIEGLVMKRKNAKLEIGNTENNNTKSMIKFRKPTKNYKF